MFINKADWEKQKISKLEWCLSADVWVILKYDRNKILKKINFNILILLILSFSILDYVLFIL